MKKSNHLLTRRDRKILEHVARYRLSTDNILRTLFFPEVQDTGPVRKVVQRLIVRRYLTEFPLAGRATYCVLAPRGARLLRVKVRKPRAFTEQTLPAILAVASYCAERGVTRFTAAEFRERFPELWKPGSRSSAYCLEPAANGLHLVMFLADRGAGPKRLLEKIRRVIAQRYRFRAFAQLIQAKRFGIVILTGYNAKKEQLDAHIGAYHRGPVTVRVATVPELGTLLTRG